MSRRPAIGAGSSISPAGRIRDSILKAMFPLFFLKAAIDINIVSVLTNIQMGTKYVIDESFGFLVNRLATAMRRAFEMKLQKFDLTAPQFVFLARLFEEDGQPLVNICRGLYCDKPTITGIANRLEAKGLISKVRDEKDRRIIKAVLTEKGRELRDPLHKMALEVNGVAATGLSVEELAMLKGRLRHALDNVLEIIEGGVINVYD